MPMGPGLEIVERPSPTETSTPTARPCSSSTGPPLSPGKATPIAPTVSGSGRPHAR